MKREAQGDLVRTFVAVFLDDGAMEGVREYVGRIRPRVEGRVGPIRWVRPGQHHFTLRFLGDLDLEARSRVVRCVERACAGVGAFELVLGAMGAFPAVDRPRVIWLGVEPASSREAMGALAQQVEGQLQAGGLGPADRPFRPHLTLGRPRDQRRIEGEWVAAPIAQVLGREVRSRVDRVAVMASTLAPGGPLYRPLYVVSLDAAGGLAKGTGNRDGEGASRTHERSNG